MTLCLLAGTSAFAQDRRAPRTKERPTAEQMAQRKTDRMVEKLNLNEDQSKQLYELNLQEVKDMQAQHERMRAARKAKAEKMQKILTPEQFEQWKQMQGPKPGMGHGPQMKDGKGCACKEGRKCDKPRPAKGRSEVRSSNGLSQPGCRLVDWHPFFVDSPAAEGEVAIKSLSSQAKKPNGSIQNNQR